MPQPQQLRQLNIGLRHQSFERYVRILGDVLQDHSSISGFPRLSGLLRSRNYRMLFDESESLASQLYASPAEQYAVNQISQLIKKYPWDPKLIGLDPDSKAREIFSRAEYRCKWLNRRFALYLNRRSPHEYLLSKMREFIRYSIGDSPNLEEIYDRCDFGPGASVGIHGQLTNLYRKMGVGDLTVTPLATGYAVAALKRNFHYMSRFRDRSESGIECLDPESEIRRLRGLLHITNNNKLSFVPKTVKTHRVIAVEPMLNTFLQKGIDSVLRVRLKRIGIDLSDQSINQRLAREGSRRGFEEDSLSTIDLSNASDSISIGLCRYLLPPAWFNLLNNVRSHAYQDGDRVMTYQKFCSQGNGFCFPLETLIFTAICVACGCKNPKKDFHVYGDDIIVRREHFREVVSLLRICGFKTNIDKTFNDGPFRESCGADWYLGEDIRPFTLDYELDSLQNIFKFINLCRRNTRSELFFSRSILYAIRLIPHQFQFWRPFRGNPETGIDDYNGLALQSSNVGFRKSLQCYKWIELESRPVCDPGDHPAWVVNAAALRGHPSSMPFTYRRKTRTRMRFVAHSGAHSTWSPQ